MRRRADWAVDWGWQRALLALLVSVAAYVLISLAGLLAIALSGHGTRVTDAGDIVEKMGAVARYADQLLAAVSEGEPRPQPPELLASQVALQIGFLSTLVYHAAIAILGMTLVTSPGRLWREVVLARLSWRGLGRALLGAAAGYGVVLGYAAVVATLGWEPLIPESTVPVETTREPLTLALTGLVAVGTAPIAEELLFRGYLFGGLANRFGFLPAALASSALFAANHFDLGSLIPFTIVGVILCALFWRSGSLWESMAMHMIFNGTSYLLLLGMAA